MKIFRGEWRFVVRAQRTAGLFLATLAVGMMGMAAGAPAQAQNTVALDEALYGEIYGRNTQRRELLEAALVADPDSAQLHGLLGHVQVDGQWQTLRDVASPGAHDELLSEYAERRAAAEATVESQAELARWCRRQGLADRERFHWQQVRLIEPEHEAAITRLGLLQTDEGEWITRQELDQQRAWNAQFAAADDQWRPILSRHKYALENGTEEEREAAFAELCEISDEWALPTLEDLYSTEGGLLAKIAVEVVSDMQHPWATQSLMRHAIYSEEEEVRTAAIEYLKDRDLYEFVPTLLDGLQPTIEAEFTVLVDAAGNVNLRRWTRVEARDGDYISTQDQTLYQFNHVARQIRVITRESNGQHTQHFRDNTAGRARAQQQIDYRAALTAAGQQQIVEAAEAEVATINEQIETENERIYAVLAEVTGEQELETPLAWWQWWNEYNLVTNADGRQAYEQYAWQHQSIDIAPPTMEYRVKPMDMRTEEERQADYEERIGHLPDWTVAYNRETERYQTVVNGEFHTGDIPYRTIVGTDRYVRDVGLVLLHQPNVMRRYHYWRPGWNRFGYRNCRFCSCFAAGTPVWTETGLYSIEDIQPGDRVLTRDVETGELVYKIVTQTTEREPTEVLSLTVDGETFDTTPGHLFWVNGQGWTMAKDLQSGDVLHGIAGGLLVSEVTTQEEPQAVYNLVVEDHHNYFVGYRQVLAHDVTVQEPTQAIVPGLVESN